MVCRRRCALAPPSCAFNENHRTGRDVGFRLRQAYGATSSAELGFAYPIGISKALLYVQNAGAGRCTLLIQLGQNALEFGVGLK
jgi:hypothetical protein